MVSLFCVLRLLLLLRVGCTLAQRVEMLLSAMAGEQLHT